jgi:hypothetical protein
MGFVIADLSGVCHPQQARPASCTGGQGTDP